MFKPNLVPNNKEGIDVVIDIVKKHGIRNYLISKKKDGVRLEAMSVIKGRSLKIPRSIHVNSRFTIIADIADSLGIILEGEFYSHGMKFNEIQRFFSNTDVESKKEHDKITKLYNNGLLDKEYPNRSIKWLTTFHESLKFHMFDVYIKGRPNLGFQKRIKLATKMLKPYMTELGYVLVLPKLVKIDTIKKLINYYEKALIDGWEGLILIHKDHIYKFGRSTLNTGTLLKMKDDKGEFDGVVIDIEAGTKIKDGVKRTQNELGRSRTSKCKEDRELSGLASGILTEFNGLGNFIVSLKGFDNSSKKKLLRNKRKYIGRHFIYTASPPTKDFPRHAQFKSWRDDK